jgi:uncharacterized glyoxalase superfamily protein PhnB
MSSEQPKTELTAAFAGGLFAITLFVQDLNKAEELVSPFGVANPGAGAQGVYTLRVKDVDLAVEQLLASGVEMLNGPLDRPWGVRTASFQDPSGNIWEIADHA